MYQNLSLTSTNRQWNHWMRAECLTRGNHGSYTAIPGSEVCFRWAQASLWGMFCYSTFLSYGVQKYISLFSLLRLVHLPLLYKHIHKKHHEWTAPIGVVSIYAHPLEHIVSGFSHGHLPLPARSVVSMGWGAVGRDAKQMLPWNLLSQKGKLSCISRKPSCRSAAVTVCTALH